MLYHGRNIKFFYTKKQIAFVLTQKFYSQPNNDYSFQTNFYTI